MKSIRTTAVIILICAVLVGYFSVVSEYYSHVIKNEAVKVAQAETEAKAKAKADAINEAAKNLAASIKLGAEGNGGKVDVTPMIVNPDGSMSPLKLLGDASTTGTSTASANVSGDKSAHPWWARTWLKWTGKFPFKLGLDLSGGAHLVYKADISKIASSDVNTSMEALRDVIEKRVNILGVSEPIVQIEQGKVFGTNEVTHKLIVELPGETDVNNAIKQIGATPRLDFRILKKSDIEALNAETNIDPKEKEALMLSKLVPTGIDGSVVERATLMFNQTTGQPSVGLQFNAEGKALFSKITKENIDNVLGIFLDGRGISLPIIRQEIKDGKAEISGSFTVEEARTLVRDLNYGALPVPVELVSTQTLGASLGDAARAGGVRAGIVAFIAISIFLIFWYRLPGLVAVVALGVYTVIMLALFKLVPVTITAAGMAGFILSIGMAVDANILIFERMREELARGRGLSDAMHEGFTRAWSSIRDSNISSVITGVILFYFGSSSIIKGFALVFVIGVLVSMFSAITASRAILYAVAPKSVVSGGVNKNNQQVGTVKSWVKFLFGNGLRFKKAGVVNNKN